MCFIVSRTNVWPGKSPWRRIFRWVRRLIYFSSYIQRLHIDNMHAINFSSTRWYKWLCCDITIPAQAEHDNDKKEKNNSSQDDEVDMPGKDVVDGYGLVPNLLDEFWSNVCITGLWFDLLCSCFGFSGCWGFSFLIDFGFWEESKEKKESIKLLRKWRFADGIVWTNSISFEPSSSSLR